RIRTLESALSTSLLWCPTHAGAKPAIGELAVIDGVWARCRGNDHSLGDRLKVSPEMNRGLHCDDRTLGWLHLQMTEHLHVGGLDLLRRHRHLHALHFQ